MARRAGVYGVLCALRLVFVLSPSYVHPDEFFQSYEVVARDALGVDTRVPWEFARTDRPLRTVTTPMLGVGIPLFLLRLLGSGWHPLAVLLVPRVVMLALSFVVDAAVLAMCRRHRIDADGPLLAVASSWTMLVVHSRPFSNTWEGVLLAALLWLVTARRKHTAGSLWAIGALATVGVFNRPTSLFFLPAVAVYLLVGRINGPPDHARRNRIVVDVGFLVVWGLLGVLSTALTIVLCDALYFGKATLSLDGQALALTVSDCRRLLDPMGWTRLHLETSSLLDAVTPLNFVAYNADPANLAEHGIHPRVLHAVVNMPLMFGSLCVAAYGSVVAALYRVVRGRRRRRRAARGTKEKTAVDRSRLRLLLAGVVAGSLAGLSLAPHQEPRFLLPLLLPLAVLVGGTVRRSRPLWVAWILFNVLAVAWFGVLHQGGLVPAMARMAPLEPGGSLIFYHTYMPPQFLLLQSANAADRTRVVDLAGAGLDALRNATTAGCASARWQRIVCPAVVDQDVAAAVCGGDDASSLCCASLRLADEQWPHISAEDFPQQPGLADAALHVWEHLCGQV